jgi:protein gp37
MSKAFNNSRKAANSNSTAASKAAEQTISAPTLNNTTAPMAQDSNNESQSDGVSDPNHNKEASRPIDALAPHPLNATIYGDEADTDLVKSVSNNGVLQPILIDQNNRIISGHRRVDAAKKAGLDTVPVTIYEATDELAIQMTLVECNRQRPKTNEQKAREATELKRIEHDKGRKRQQEANPEGGLMANLPEGERGTARDQAGKKLGMSGKKVDQCAKVIETIDRLEATGEVDVAKEIRTDLNNHSVNRALKTAQEKGVLESEAPQEAGSGEYILVKDWVKMTDEQKKEALSKPHGKSLLNEQSSDSIDWAAWSWNPITGCKHGCDYCYARDIANRFLDAKFEPAFYPGRLAYPSNTKVPSKSGATLAEKLVFTGSMTDVFGKWVPDDLIQLVLDKVKESPQWTFLFLTKYPERYADFKFPDNAWLGTTVDKQARVKAAQDAMAKATAKVKWLSCEPMLERLTFDRLNLFNWVVIGGASKSTKTAEFFPPRDWVTHLWDQAIKAGCAIYEKPNLLKRCQEYPAQAPTAARAESEVTGDGELETPGPSAGRAKRRGKKAK